MKITKIAQEHIKELCKSPKNIFGMDIYNYHFVYVVKYAKVLAKQTGADSELLEIVGWLHDVGSIKGYYKDHHIYGAKYIEKFLKKHNYPEDKIKNAVHCVLSHRASKNIKRKTIEAQCLADADSMSHFGQITSIFNLAFIIRKLSVEKADKFVKNKLNNSYKNLSPMAKKIIKPKFDALKIVLK